MRNVGLCVVGRAWGPRTTTKYGSKIDVCSGGSGPSTEQRNTIVESFLAGLVAPTDNKNHYEAQVACFRRLGGLPKERRQLDMLLSGSLGDPSLQQSSV